MVNSPSLNTRYLLLFWRLFIPIIIAIVKDKQQRALAADALCKYNRNEKILPINITGMNLLLVEDSPLNAEIAQFLLEDAGAKMELAGNGQEAVEAFSAHAPGYDDVILRDVMMPILDGYQATQAIRALDRSDGKTVPIVAMTANAFLEDIAKCRQAGMNDHLAKPLDMDRTLRVIARYRKNEA